MMDHLKKVMCTIITNIRPRRIKPIDHISRKKYCANGISIFFDVFSKQILYSYRLLLLVCYYGRIRNITMMLLYNVFIRNKTVFKSIVSSTKKKKKILIFLIFITISNLTNSYTFLFHNFIKMNCILIFSNYFFFLNLALKSIFYLTYNGI